MTTSSAAASDPSPSYRAIGNLIVAYARLVDDGDFAGLDASHHLRQVAGQ